MKRALLWLTALAAATAACAGSPGTSAEPTVVVGFYPLEYLAVRLGAEDVTVRNVTPPGAEPHDLELRASDVSAIRDAELVIYLREFQPALEDALEGAPDGVGKLDALAGIEVTAAAGEEELSFDPHVWLDPMRYRTMAGIVSARLVQLVPDAMQKIKDRLTALERELSALDDEAKRALASCKRKEIFTSHAAFGYLADAYGLEQVAIDGLSPEGEPSSKRLQDIARRARAAGTTTIYFETLVSPRVADALARIVGATTAVLDPIEGIDDPKDDYFTVMRANLRALATGQDCSP